MNKSGHLKLAALRTGAREDPSCRPCRPGKATNRQRGAEGLRPGHLRSCPAAGFIQGQPAIQARETRTRRRSNPRSRGPPKRQRPSSGGTQAGKSHRDAAVASLMTREKEKLAEEVVESKATAGYGGAAPRREHRVAPPGSRGEEKGQDHRGSRRGAQLGTRQGQSRGSPSSSWWRCTCRRLPGCPKCSRGAPR